MSDTADRFPAAPPQNLDAEQEILGTILAFYQPGLVHVAQAAGLKRGDWYRHDHEIVYRAILVLHGRGQARLELLSSFAVVNGYRERCRIVAEDAAWRQWLLALYEAQECVHCRDDAGFWDAVGRLRKDVPAGTELRVVRGSAA